MDRRHRLTSARDFRRVMRDGRRAASGSVACTILRTGEAAPPKLGISAPRALGGAVQRNRAKRVIRAAMRPRLDGFEPGTQIVVAARSSVLTRNFNDLQADLARALDTAAKA
jgi:ribonuclease P protein component